MIPEKPERAKMKNRIDFVLALSICSPAVYDDVEKGMIFAEITLVNHKTP